MLDRLLGSPWSLSLIYIAIIGFGMLLSYGAALAGHPNAVWFWGDMLGLL